MGKLFTAVGLFVGLLCPAWANMSPPAGYTTNQLIFDDTFPNTTLDPTKWIPQIADQHGIWRQSVPAPYSAINSGSFQTNYYDPYPQQGTNVTGPHVVTGNGGGLRLIAVPSSQFAGYTWASGVVCTHGLFTFTGGYLQISAKMPDSRTGMWAGIWSLEGGAEIDTQESGYLLGSTNPNQVMASHWQGTGGNQIIQDTGVDLSAAYHTYGMEYIPGTSIKMYLDGALKATWTSSISTGGYTILLDLEVMDNLGSSWHTVVGPNTPNPSEFDVAEVQVYSLGMGAIGDTTIEGSIYTAGAGTALATPFTATGTGAIGTLTAVFGVAPSAKHGVLGIYADNGGTPGTLLGQTGSIAIGGRNWYSGTLAPAVQVVSGTKYWLAILGTDPSGSTANLHYKNGTCNSYLSSAGNLTSLPSTWSGAQTIGKCDFSVYGH